MSDINFVNIDATDIEDEILKQLEEATGEDLYPGDERRIFGEALTAVLINVYNKLNDSAKQKMLAYARGDVLDALGERTATYRKAPEKATATLRFAATNDQVQNIIIPSGTKAKSNNELYFETIETKVIEVGNEYVDVEAHSVDGGSEYNGLRAGTINILVDLIPLVKSVSNTIETYGGDNGEPYTEEGDNEYRERIRLSTSKYSTAGPEGAYIYHALSADPEIDSVSVTSPNPGTVLITPLMNGGVLPTQEVLDKILTVCNDKTVRPLTDLVLADSPTPVEFDIEFKYYVTAKNEASAIETIEDEGGAIDHYIAWQVGAMGRDINPDKLRKFVLSPDWIEGLQGAERLDITSPTLTEIGDISVAQFSGNLTVSHEVVIE